MSALDSASAEAEARAARLARRRGRTLVWAAILPLALVELLELSVALASGTGAISGVLRVVLTVVVLWLTLNGNRHARRWFVFLCAVGFLFSLSMLVETHGVTRALVAVFLGQTAFAFWVFALSDDAKAYLDGRTAAPIR